MAAASEEVVEKAMIAGSRTALMKPRSGTRAISAMGTSATSTKKISATQSVTTSFPRS